MTPRRPRTSIYFRMFSPYILSRLSAAAEAVDLAAIEGASRSATYAWEPIEGAQSFDRFTLFEGKMIEHIPRRKIVREVWRIMETLRPEVVVIGGWGYIESITMLCWAAKNAAPVIVMSESSADDKSRFFLFELVKRFIVKFCSSALVGGGPHSRYIATLGMAADRIFKGYDAVDNNYFSKRAEAVRTQTAHWRKALDLPERFFLTCCRFIPVKNLGRLIEAYSAYRILSGSQAWDLVLVGDGPERGSAEARVQKLNLQESVRFKGFCQYEELPAYYALAGALVHVSTVEPWGLVINEALASRLPVVVSNRCGAAEDLIVEGVNGVIIDPYAAGKITSALHEISSPALDREQMGRIGFEIVQHWGPSRFADGLRQAIDTARSRPVRHACGTERLLLWAIGYLTEYRKIR